MNPVLQDIIEKQKSLIEWGKKNPDTKKYLLNHGGYSGYQANRPSWATQDNQYTLYWATSNDTRELIKRIETIESNPPSLTSISAIYLKKVNDAYNNGSDDEEDDEYGDSYGYYDDSGYGTNQLLDEIIGYWENITDDFLIDFVTGSADEIDFEGGRLYLASHAPGLYNEIFLYLISKPEYQTSQKLDDQLYNSNHIHDAVSEMYPPSDFDVAKVLELADDPSKAKHLRLAEKCRTQHILLLHNSDGTVYGTTNNYPRALELFKKKNGDDQEFDWEDPKVCTWYVADTILN